MNWYSLVQRYYNLGYYTVDQVKVFVVANKITEAEFTQITGQPYVPAA